MGVTLTGVCAVAADRIYYSAGSLHGGDRMRPTLLLAVLFWGAAVAGAADNSPNPSLHLVNDGFLPGEVRGSEDAKVLRWHSPHFTKPFDFPLSAVKLIHYPVKGALPKAAGEYCFELAGDDVIHGNLLGLTDQALEIDAGRFGRVHVRRGHVRRFYRLQGADSIYLGPNGLSGWTESSPPPLAPVPRQQAIPAGGNLGQARTAGQSPTSPQSPAWRDEGGQLVTERAGTLVSADVGLPAKAVIEFELSWKQKPNFVFALGVDPQDPAGRSPFRFETWDGDLAAVLESERDADVAAVQPIGSGEGRTRVQVYLDQEQGRLIVLSRSGKLLADLKLDAKKPRVQQGVRLTNHKGDVRLEYLRISRWTGLVPCDVREDQARLHRMDGSLVYGALAGFDPKLKHFTVRDAKGDTLVKQADLADAFLAPSLADAKPGAAPGADSNTALRVVYQDGSRMSGQIKRFEDTHLSMACSSVIEPLRLPLAGLRSIIMLGNKSAPDDSSSSSGRSGRLETESLRLHGRLVNGTARPEASCLVWQPDLAQNASPLLPGTSGRIVYRDPPPPRVRQPQVPRVPVAQPAPGFGQFIAGIFTGGPSTPQPNAGRRALHLRCGDTIPCDVSLIDEKGITFKTPNSDAKFVAHEKIKSVELVPTQNLPRLKKAKRDRLLTLPRLQRDTPPTHLICSKSGDILRGRVVEMDFDQLKVEVRLEIKEVPRDRVAQIIWLHADELAGAKIAAAPTKPASALRVQTLRGNGDRLTFVADKFDNKTISGVSDLLGACRADVTEIDQLLFGSHIEESAAKLADHRWKLHHATEPKFAQAGPDAAAGRATGTESPLVGQPALPFKLDLLDGRPFQLADHKGKIVVLDFWATWCGPCLQAMPQIDAAVREFAGDGVELFAVNLEEQPEQIKSMLERHKLKMPVVLDRDGVVAAKYNVTAIPQTVIIDREGKVARLFVGGGPKVGETLKKALQELKVANPAPAVSPAQP